MPQTEKPTETDIELIEVEVDAETLWLLDSDTGLFPDLTPLIEGEGKERPQPYP